MNATRKSPKRRAARSPSKQRGRQTTSGRAALTNRAKRRTLPAQGEAVSAVPPILLEGDAPGTPSPLSAAVKASSVEPLKQPPVEASPLPEAYGSQRLMLTPRDPHWIHAHWDFTPLQLRAASERSATGGLTLRLTRESVRGPLVSESSIQPGVVRWMLHAPEPAARYAAELGYYDREREWSMLAVADPVRTPPSTRSGDRQFEMGTLTPDGRLERRESFETPPLGLQPIPACDTALSSLRFQDVGQVSSLGLPLGLPGVGVPAPSSLGVAAWSAAMIPTSWPTSSMALPARAAFRLEVDADLMVYGSTASGASLQIGDRAVALDENGQFRLRFSFPEGAHELIVRAVCAETGEVRRTILRFERHTDASGEAKTAELPLEAEPPTAKNL